MIYERKINYYETDRMGIVHHSNYIRFLEESRCYLLDEIGMSFDYIEQNGITIPVLGVNCEYKNHVTYGDTILVDVSIKEYNGVRLKMGYEIKDKETGKLVLTGETKHCFTDKNLRPINLKKHSEKFHNEFERLLNA